MSTGDHVAVGQCHPLLCLHEVHKTFPSRGPEAKRFSVLEGVSLTVSTGEAVGVIGGSGAGKSTLARLIVGLTSPDRGRILFEGRDLVSLSGSQRRSMLRHLHLIFQDPYDALPPSMRVREIVAEPLAIHGIGTQRERIERAKEALEEVALAPASSFLARYAHELSGGERQRVALARGLIHRPRLIVADEPTSMVDASLRLDLLRLMRRFIDKHGIAYLYITHDLALARAFCERLVILWQGRVVEEGPTVAVIQRPQHSYTAALVRGAQVLLP